MTLFQTQIADASNFSMTVSFGFQHTEGQLWMIILAAQAMPYIPAPIGAWSAHRYGEQAV